MHTDRRRSEGVVGREDERAPVLTAVVGSVLGSCDDVMPSGELYVSCWPHISEAGSGRSYAYSRMLDSEGWAVMYGGGFSVMDLYSRVN